MRNTYMMGADYYQDLDEIDRFQKLGRPLIGVGERCYIDNTIIDKSACIGNDVRINGGPHLDDGDFDTHTVRDGIVVIKKKAVIPNNTVIGTM